MGRTDIFPRETLKVTRRYVEFKKSQTLPDDKYKVVNELVDLRAKNAQGMDKINKLQTDMGECKLVMDDIKLSCQHEIDTLNGKLRLCEIRQVNIRYSPIHSSPTLMHPPPFWLGGLDRINTSPVLQTPVQNSTPSLIANPAQSAMNSHQVSVAESQKQQDLTQGQHGDNHRHGDERHQQINQEYPTINVYNNITGDSSDFTMSMGYQAFIKWSIAEITDSDNDNTIMQSQNRSTHNRNEHMPSWCK